MRKKLDTRIPASRIKKIMQADEDVGKIALPVPLLVSKALELFLQTLCKETCKITIERGAKTISAAHLKQCVQRFDDFDFLREIVNKVPDMRSSDASGEGRNGNRKRKALEEDGSEEEFKRARTGNGRGHRRGRGRGRGARGGKSSGKTSVAAENFEDEDLDLSPESSSDEQAETLERCADVTVEARGHRRGSGRGRGARGGKSTGKTSVAPENFEDEDLDLCPESSSDEQAETLERCADVTVEARGHRRGRGRGRGRGARGGKSSGKTSVAPENFEDEDLDLSPESSSDEQAETLERCADVTVEARGHRRGRGRGRGRGARGGKSTGKTSVAPENFEDEDLDLSPESSSDEQAETLERCADVTVEARGHRRGRGRGRGRGSRGGKSSGKTSVAPENFEDEDLDLSPESSSDEQAETLERCADVTVKARGHRRGRGRGRGRGARGGKSSGKTSVAPENFEDEDLDLSPESSSDEQAETLERCADVTVEAREPTEKVVLGSTAPFVRDFDLNLDLDDDGNVVSSQPNVKHLDAEVSQPIVIHLNAEVSQSDLKQEELYPNWSHSNGYDLDIDRLHFQMHLDRTIDQDEDDYDNDEG